MRKRMYSKFFILGIVTLGMMMASTDMMSQGRGHFKFEGNPLTARSWSTPGVSVGTRGFM